MNKIKLELNWINKNIHPRLEPRILLEDTQRSHHADYRMGGNDIFDNQIIFGDNLLALKALEQEFAGRIKCVFIDPPYNTGAAFTHYDDGIEHSLWLTMMRNRLELLGHLLSQDGSIWITLDDNEVHYAKVMCDEIFGRSNFVSTIIWQKKYTQANDAVFFSDNHDYIIIYAKNKSRFKLNKLERDERLNAAYKNPDQDLRGPWKATPLHAKSGNNSNFHYKFKNGIVWSPPSGTYPRFSVETLARMDNNNEIWFGKNGSSVPSRKTFLSEVQEGVVSKSLWLFDEVGHNHEAKTEVQAFNSTEPFATPKPERLIHRILQLASNPGDWVLDSFAGSGTTGAVAHKMGRRWIMVELGEHCYTHILPRLHKVIDGTDKGGISEAVCWRGGGGFRYYNLAPSLLEKDRWGQWIINTTYNKEMLAEALCKIEGFKYEPSDTVYWQQGRSTESDYLYVTTQSFSVDQLQELSDDVGPERSLLVLCTAFKGDGDAWENLTVRKIPKQVLHCCEWGHDDYSLKVENLPAAPRPPGQQTLFTGDAGDGGGSL